MVIHQDASLSVAELSTGKRLAASLADGRHGYLHVAHGTVQVGDTKLIGGDAITFDGATSLDITATEDSQLLFFDLA
jgi:redox-sensitive bicupin YhaK (pirin superfamily)